jgi:ElaB/YqjD/DUF883 family membrane-anchored ribosome-binding protein
MNDPYASPYVAEVEYDGIIEDAARLKDDVAALAREIPAASEDVKRTLARIEENIGKLYDEAAWQAGQAVRAVEDAVEDHPWKSMAAAFGFGCLLTLLMARPRWR